MKIYEQIRKFLFENREEILQIFEAEQKELQDKLEKKLSEGKEKKTLLIDVFEQSIAKDLNGEYVVVRGVASNKNLDRVGDIILPEGIQILSGHNGKLPMLHNHDHKSIIGSWYSFGVKEDKYVVEGRLYKAYSPVVFEQVKNGDLSALSIALS